MVANGIPEALVRTVSPSDARDYAAATGWQRVAGVRGRIVVFTSPVNGLDQLIIPLDADVPDYGRRMTEVLTRLSGKEGRPPAQVLNDLLSPSADVLRFRIDGPNLAKGFLPLDEGISLLDGARKALLAAAHTAIEPKPFYPRLRRIEAEQFISRCHLGQTERGSFVATVSCPIGVIHERQPGVDQRPLARRATGILMQSVADLASAIEDDDLDRLTRPGNGGAVLSANLCEAILEMQPPEDDVNLTVGCSWARTLAPERPDLPSSVRLRREYAPAIEEVARSLRPTTGPNRPQVYVGVIEALRGEPDADNQMRGEVVFTFQDAMSEQVLRARIQLSPPDYLVACDAHKSNFFVSLRGLLIRGARVHRFETYQDFRIFQP